MAKISNFDATEVQPSHFFGTIPDGTYPAEIIESDWKDTKKGTGKFLELTFQVTEGPYMGSVHRVRLNLENPSSVAVDIARADLSAICHAVGVLQPKDSAELHDKPLLIHVQTRKRPNTGVLENEVRGFMQAKSEGPGSEASAAEDSPEPETS